MSAETSACRHPAATEAAEVAGIAQVTDPADYAKAILNILEDTGEEQRKQAEEKERLEQLEKFQRLTVGRELKMIELKKEIEYLRKYGAGELRKSDTDW